MIDLATTLADQEDLDALCAPKGDPMAEAYWPNSNYGHAYVLKAYAGYPPRSPVQAVIPHGVDYEDGFIFDGEATAPVPAVLSWPELKDDAYRATGKHVIPSAAPFLYAMKVVGASPAPDRAGTLFAPYHSTAAVDVDTDWERLADLVAALDERFRPVTVLIHWQDHARGRHQAFLDRGLRVVSAGYLSDPMFLGRLIHLTCQHKYAASNEVSSNLMYSVSLGIPYFLAGERVDHVLAADAPREMGLSPKTRERMEAVRALFSEPVDEVTEEQKACADLYLGASRFKTPGALKMDLQYCEFMARRG